MSFFADLEIGYFEDYLDLIKKTIEDDSKKLEQKYQEIKESGAKPFTNEDGQHWDPYDDVADEGFRLDEIAQLMYRTYVIGVFIFIEDQINNVCSSIERTDKLMFSYKDLKGSGVSRSIKYLETVTGKVFPAYTETKEHFEIARIIRNSLVHQDGQIDDRDELKIEAYIAKYPKILSLNQIRKISITHDYAKILVNLSRKINLELEKYVKAPSWLL